MPSTWQPSQRTSSRVLQYQRNSLSPNEATKATGLNDYDYNPEKAKELLAEANWDADYELDVVYYYTDQQTVDFMAAIQSYLKDVGIKMNLQTAGRRSGIPSMDTTSGSCKRTKRSGMGPLLMRQTLHCLCMNTMTDIRQVLPPTPIHQAMRNWMN